MQIVKSDYDLKLEFTPLEFETSSQSSFKFRLSIILEFTPLEFETPFGILKNENNDIELEFTPLEFETKIARCLECSL